MPFTTVAFAENNTPTGALLEVDAVPDQHVKTEAQFVFVSAYNRVIGAKALLGALPLQCRLMSPSIRRLNPYHITQLEAAIVQAGNVEKTFHPNKYVTLVPNEQLECEISATAGVFILRFPWTSNTPSPGGWLEDSPMDLSF